MCQCENKQNFKSKIKEAFNFTQQSEKQYVVFGGTNPMQKDVLWIATENFAMNDVNVCCYFKPISETEYQEIVKQKKAENKTKKNTPKP